MFWMPAVHAYSTLCVSAPVTADTGCEVSTPVPLLVSAKRLPECGPLLQTL